MAAVNADTWATELGILNPTAPRLITTGKTVEKGTSGGISSRGHFRRWQARPWSALVAALFSLATGALGIIFIASLSGLAGSLFDSLLGATVQAIYYCPACQKETERHPLHTCGTQTIRVRGWYWLNNDLVNFACSSAGALSAIGLWLVLAGAH